MEAAETETAVIAMPRAVRREWFGFIPRPLTHAGL
jgi:hypothetical protein